MDIKELIDNLTKFDEMEASDGMNIVEEAEELKKVELEIELSDDKVKVEGEIDDKEFEVEGELKSEEQEESEDSEEETSETSIEEPQEEVEETNESLTVKKLTEELSDYIEDKLEDISWETLDDILKLGCEVPNEDMPEYVQNVLAPENTGAETIIKLWSDIEGTFEGNQAKIIELMREDLDNYIPDKITELKEV